MLASIISIIGLQKRGRSDVVPCKVRGKAAF